ncbi:TPA: SEC10/PgrA surface exclusion domain-containing protein, partial [Streptococcus suis]
KLKAYGAVGVLSIGMMTTVGTVSAKAEEVAGTAIVATTTTSTEVTQGQVDQAQAQVDTSKAALDQATANVATAEQAVSAAEATYTTATDVANDKQTEVATAQEQVDNNPTVAQAQEQVESATQTVTNTQNEIKEAQADVSNLENHVSANETAVANAETQVANAETAKAQADKQLAQDVADEKTAQDAVTSAQADVNTAKAVVAEKEAAVTAASQEVTVKENEVATAETKLAEAQAADAKRQADINTAQTEVNTAQTSVNNAQTQLDNANANLRTVESNISTAQTELDKANLALNSIYTVELSETYKDLLDQFYKARYVTKDTTEMNRVWTLLQSESDRLMTASINAKNLRTLRDGLNAIESNKRVVVAANSGGLNQLTREDRLELTQFAQTIINDLRSQMGITSEVLVTEGSLDLANMVAKEYLADDWDMTKGHNSQALLRVQDATNSRIEEDADPWSYTFTSDATMTTLKVRLATAIEMMMLDDYSQSQHFGHAISLIGLDSKYLANEAGNQYFGLSGYTGSKNSALLMEFNDHGVVSSKIAGTPIANPISK